MNWLLQKLGFRERKLGRGREYRGTDFFVRMEPIFRELVSIAYKRQKRREGAPPTDIETLRNQTPRMMSLLHAVRGKRERFEILAKSKEF